MIIYKKGIKVNSVFLNGALGMDKDAIKKNISEKLPQALPKVIKFAVTHILMFVFHFHMPMWATAVKAKKSVNSMKNAKQGQDMNDEQGYYRPRRRMRTRRHRYSRISRGQF